MKRLLLFSILIVACISSHAQGGVWTWVKGDSTLNYHGNIGTKGVSNTVNFPPYRYQAAQWTDLNGNLWLFGGNDSVGKLHNDLWKYDPANNIWTWVSGPLASGNTGAYGTIGVPGPNNLPPCRGWGSVSWTDQEGRLWLHGGSDSWGYYGNDLWMYDIPSNQWTCMWKPDTANHGSASYGEKGVSNSRNSPGDNSECNSFWVRSDGTLWTFGGNARGNNMWKFDISTNNWTWMSGDSSGSLSYSYGIKNIEAPSNIPRRRMSYSHWQDANDNFYVFGGAGDYNDVWRFNTTNNYWTWIGGDSTINSYGLYGHKCAMVNNARPNARSESRTAQTSSCSNTGWLYGGSSVRGNINDLWAFDLQTHLWTWVSGDSFPNNPGHYGSKGIPSASNVPPASNGFCFWGDPSGKLWLWILGSMWKFAPDTSCVHMNIAGSPPIALLSDSNLCNNDSAKLIINGGSVVSVSPSAGVVQTDPQHIIFHPSARTSYTVVATSTCGIRDSLHYTISVSHSQSSASQRSICLGDSVLFAGHYLFSSGLYSDTTVGVNGCDSVAMLTLRVDSLPAAPTITRTGTLLTSSPAAHYQWQYNGTDISGDTLSHITMSENGTYTVIVTNASGCSNSSSITITNVGINSLHNDKEISIYPNPATQSCTIFISGYNGENYIAKITDVEGRVINSEMPFAASSFTFPVSLFAKGIYLLQVTDNDNHQTIKKLVIE